MADFDHVLASLRRTEAELQNKLASVQGAIASLSGGTTRRPAKRGPGRPAGTGTRKRRKMSAAARKAISDAQKARWAKQKAGKK